MTSNEQGDSMWLQKSITLPDPFPTVTGDSLLGNTPELQKPVQTVNSSQHSQQVIETATSTEESEEKFSESSTPSPLPKQLEEIEEQRKELEQTIIAETNTENYVKSDEQTNQSEAELNKKEEYEKQEESIVKSKDMTEHRTTALPPTQPFVSCNDASSDHKKKEWKKCEVNCHEENSNDIFNSASTQDSKSFDMMCPPVTLPTASASAEQKPVTMSTSIVSKELQKLGHEMTNCTNLANSRSSMSRFSTRASMSAVNSFITSSEYDELRSRYTQAKRELLRLSDIQKDLEFTHFELERSQENVKLMRESYRQLKLENDEILQHAEKAHKARVELESRMEVESASHAKELTFLRRQIEELRLENASRVDELTQQHEGEYQRRVQSMVDELNARDEQREELLRQLEQLEADKKNILQHNTTMQQECAKMQETITELESKVSAVNEEYKNAERRFQITLREFEKERDDTLRAHSDLNEERIKKITSMKDERICEMEKELMVARDKMKATSDELQSSRESIQHLNEEVMKLKEVHAKQLRQVEEQHHLDECEWKVQMENAVREAKGGKFSLEEEIQSLRRQLEQMSEECAESKKALAQRDKDAQKMEVTVSELTDALRRTESENAQLQSDYALSQSALDDATERVERLLSQKDKLEDDFTSDLRKAKSRIRELEQSLIETHNELSTLRKEHVQGNDEHRATVTRLRHELEEANAERSNLVRAATENEQSQATADEYRKKFVAEKQKAESLNVELSAAIGRCAALEKRLDEELRKVIATSVSRSSVHRKPSSLRSISSSPPPPPTTTSTLPSHTSTTVTDVYQSTTNKAINNNNNNNSNMNENCGSGSSNHYNNMTSSSFPSRAPRMRSHSSLNASLSTPSANIVKRARTEDARVFAISGFDDNELLLSIKQLPNVAIAECKSNAPVPSNLTHLVTNGQLTIKLLSALVRGCWILPSSYIADSLKSGHWLNESDSGFQHSNPPLLKRRICLTDQFMSCKHYSTANLLLKEGGAVIVSNDNESEADCVLCTNAELPEIVNGISWEGLIASIYPVRVEESPAALQK